MPVSNPYPNIYRHGSAAVNAPYEELGNTAEFRRFVASYEILKKDLRRVFEYLEPAPANLGVYSHRLLELLLRSCTEVESLCKLVFRSNGVELGRGANIIRFSDLEGPMKLSEYEVFFPAYDVPSMFPFREFRETDRTMRGPAWYKSYNAAKHDRGHNFKEANLGNVLHALGGAYVLLIAQIGLYFDTRLQLGPAGVNKLVPDVISFRTLPVWSEDERYEFRQQCHTRTAQFPTAVM